MNIVLISQDDSLNLNVGGKHIHQNTFLAEAKKLGYNVDTIFPKREDISLSFATKVLFRMGRSFTGIGAQIFEIYVGKIIDSLSAQIEQNIESIQSSDVVVCHDPISTLSLGRVCRKLGINRPRNGLILHGYYTWEMFNYGYYGQRSQAQIYKLGMDWEREAAGYADKIITVDSRIRSYLENDLAVDTPIDVVFNSINVDKFRLDSAAGKNQRTLLATRRFVKKNGVYVAIQAAKYLKEAKEEFSLTLVGDGPEWNNVKAEVAELGLEPYVHFVGAVDYGVIESFYKSHEILLMPSIPSDNIEEATSLSMLEGMVARCITICSAIGGMKEVIRHRENGFLVKPADPKALADQILEIFHMSQQERDQVTHHAYQYVMENHESKEHTKKVLSAITDVG